MDRMAMEKPPKAAHEGQAQPVSAKIRARVEKANKRYFANDNIAQFIEPGEMDAQLVGAGFQAVPHVAVAGEDKLGVTGIRLKNNKEGTTEDLPASGLPAPCGPVPPAGDSRRAAGSWRGQRPLPGSSQGRW